MTAMISTMPAPARTSRRRVLGILLLTATIWLPRPSLQSAESSGRFDLNRYPTSTEPFPLAITGFSGEVLSTLRFDLEVAGCKAVSETEAQLILAGSNAGQVEGRLMDRNKSIVFSKAYNGGAPRQQAHALADDVVKALGGRGVAQTQIAFKGEITQGKSEVYVADYDGHNAQKATSDGSIVAAPTWVPGKRALVYTSYRLGNPDIFFHDLSGSRRPLSRQAGLNTAGAVSPDGQTLAMILSKDGSPNVYTMRMDGSGLKRLTDNRQGDSSPCWSPDGQTICFSSRSGGPSSLYTISASGGQPRHLRLVGVSNGTEPDWSPDGKMIVFTTQSGGRFEVCVVPAAGGEVNRLVPGEDPVWAPNSRTVVCARRIGEGNRVLSLLDVPTRQTKDLPRISGSCSQPTWAR